MMARSNAACRPFLAVVLLALLTFAQPGSTAEDFVFLPALRVDEPEQMQLLDIARAGERLVAVGERGVIILSDDHGRSWRQAEVPVSTTLTAVHFPEPDSGWAVGHAGAILHSADGGDTWELQFDGREANRQYLAWAQARAASLEAELAASEDAEQLGALEEALDEAQFAAEDAADAIDTGPADPFLDVLFTDAKSGFAIGAYGMLYRTDNGGDDWRIAIDGIANPYRYHYYAIAQDSAGGLYLSGEAGLLYHSEDAGSTWRRVEDLYDGSLFGLIVSGERVYAYGLRGHIFKASTASADWAEFTNNNGTSLYGGVRLADGQALMVGAGGLALAISENGTQQAWRHPSRASLSSAVQAANGDVWLVGMSGLMALSEANSL